MTYCVAMCLADGLVFASDSRTNAGVDHIATFKKLHVFHQEGERVLVLQSAGNLATTQSVISLLSARIRTQQEPNLMQVTSLYDAAMLIGKTLLEVIQRDSSNQQTCSNTNFNCNLLLGGQIAGETHRLFHIYPEGNFIEATRDTPYFQIGESKYGKPIIDRVLTIDTPLEQAMCCALISIDSTLRSNRVRRPAAGYAALPQRQLQQCRAASHHRQRSLLQPHSQGVVRRAVAHLPDSADLDASGAGRGVVAVTLRRYRRREGG